MINRPYPDIYREIELSPIARTDATDAGAVNIAVASGGRVRILALTCLSNIDHSATDLTSLEFTCGASGVNTLIAAADCAAADIAADEAQVSSGGDSAGVVLKSGSNVIMTAAGAGVDTIDIYVCIRYAAVDPGAIMEAV